MTISQKLEKCYTNQLKNIKNEKNYESKIRQIGSLALDLGKRSINIVAKVLGYSWRFVHKCYIIVRDKLEIISNKNKCGRKKVTDIYPELKQDIINIMENNTYTDPHFETDKLYVNLTIKQIMQCLINTGKYLDGFICNSSLANLLNEMGYNLKKVKRTKPLKKIEETDAIFENVKKKKEEAMLNPKAALISIDTKDKVLIGPYSRRGKSRIQIEACDHELTNNCLTPFGILDIKTNQTYFYNFINKPTSLAMVDCLEDYVKQNKNYEKIYILLDNGPDNSGSRTAFLKGLVDLANKYQIEIELVYYPPYHSKYNPIERLWSRLEMKWNGMLLTSVNICRSIMKKLTWKEIVSKEKLIIKEYEKGVKYSKEDMKLYESNIIRTEVLKKWSIIITPTKLDL